MNKAETQAARDGLQAELEDGLSGEVRFDAVAKTLYRTDASIYEIEPVGLVQPRHAEDVAQAIRLADRHGVPVLPRGGGTSLAGQSVGAAVHLDLSKHMQEILELNVEEKWVRVQPGVVLDELNEYLAPHGLLFAPDPATSSRANIGGMIGTNSSGAHSILYGKTVDHVLSVDMILADGTRARFGAVDEETFATVAALQTLEGQCYREIRRLVEENRAEIQRRFPKVMRRVSGYNLDELASPDQPFNLAKIIVGSEGTLGVVVEAKLNLVDKPDHSALVACHFADLVESMEATVEILQTAPASVELIDKILLDLTKGSIEHVASRRFLDGDPAAILFVEYYGNSERELWEKASRLQERLGGRNLGYSYVEAFSPQDKKMMWDLRKAGLGLLMSMKGDAKPNPGVEDTCVPVEVLPEYVRRVEALMEECGVVADYYGHASVGVLHIRPIVDLKTEAGVATLRLLEDRMSDIVKEYGGSMSAEHGDGLARSEWIAKMFGPQLIEVFAQVKAVFDPQSRMNPGKIVDPPPMDQNLRYGPQYRAEEPATFFNYDQQGGFGGAVEMCSGVGHCRKKLVGTMCPSYMATLEEEHSTRGRANALRAALAGKLPGGLGSHELYQVMDLCLECKGCKAECPSSVDMAKLKYEFLAHYYQEHGYPLRARLFGHIAGINRWVSKAPRLANWAMGHPLNRWFLDRFVGIDKRRSLPALAGQRFSRWFAGRSYKVGEQREKRGQVVLFNDTFVEYNDPQIGMAATILLERAGYEVILAGTDTCCGRPLISKGFLAEARQKALAAVETLAPYAEKCVPILGLEPSCILSFGDDYLDLLDDPRAEKVAQQSQLLEEFLAQQARQGELSLEFTRTPRRILVHAHCHQKALVGSRATLEVLNLPPGYKATEIVSGCCGMAGSFGYEKEHYEISMKVGEERLFEVVRQADPAVKIAAVGTSCRHQIAAATGREVRHWAEILVEAL
ncbi:MAG: FAD-binding protein [Candidatus Latescibacteria bacterium]|nr:FAD-binding protein [Candidatus Latescibacterota bacterium]